MNIFHSPPNVSPLQSGVLIRDDLKWIQWPRYVNVSSDCGISLTAHVHSVIHKQGFHREMESNVSWIIENIQTKIDCSLMLIHHIPREMFVDLDEIKRLYSNKIIPLGMTSDFDVEQPAHISSVQSLLVYPTMKKEETNSYLQLKSKSILPVHWRYQQPTEDQYYATVSLPQPTVYGRCQGMSTWEHHMKQCFNKQESVQYPCNSDNSEMCEWFSLKQNLNNQDNEMIVFAVPVAIKTHTNIVAFGTITVTLSSIWILLKLPWFDVNEETK